MFAGRVFGRDKTVEGTTVRVLLVQFCEAGGTLEVREKAHTKWRAFASEIGLLFGPECVAVLLALQLALVHFLS